MENLLSFDRVTAFEKDGIQKVKFEYNPSKSTDREKLLLEKFRNLSIFCTLTRVDIAFDIPLPIETLDAKTNPVTKTIVYKDRQGNLQTKYLGSPKLEKIIRFYSRIALVHTATDVTRLEFQLRKRILDKFLEKPDELLAEITVFSKNSLSN